MDIKKLVGVVLIAVGFIGLIIGILGIFEGANMLGLNPWGPTILGLIFFISGIGLLKSMGKGQNTTVVEQK
jgi:hypothetical protein